MFVNGTCPPNGAQLKMTGYPVGTHPAWTGKARGAGERTAAYFAALKLAARIDDGLTHGNYLYRGKTTGQPLITLDEVVRAILDDSLVMMESLCQDCLRPNPAHPDNKGQCAMCGGETCSCLAFLDTLARLRAGERDKARLGLRLDTTTHLALCKVIQKKGGFRKTPNLAQGFVQPALNVIGVKFAEHP